MITLNSDKLTVKISEKGAEIHSVTDKNNTEFIWCGDENVWSFHAPILFPICGGLKEDRYIYNGKEYTLIKHGFIRNCVFDVEYNDDLKAVFLFKSNAQTLACYPFDFEFRVIFELTGNQLKVTYNVQNKTNGEMLFSVGAHEAYACPEGIEEYDIIFDKTETLDARQLNGTIISKDNNVRMLENENVLPLKKKFFQTDALIFFNPASDKVTLKHRNSARAITLHFPEHKYFLIWTKPEGDYICLEPWCGIADIEGSDYELVNKTGINKINENEEYNAVHTITFTA